MFNTLETKIYALYDLELKSYSYVFCGIGRDVQNFYSEMVNSVGSIFYERANSFEIVCLSDFNISTGEITLVDRFVLCRLSQLIDKKRVERQQMVQSLNYIPIGYYRMPKEMQDDINSRINDALSTYIEYEKENILNAK